MRQRKIVPLLGPGAGCSEANGPARARSRPGRVSQPCLCRRPTPALMVRHERGSRQVHRCLFAGVTYAALSAGATHGASSRPRAPFVQIRFSFLSSVVDARQTNGIDNNFAPNVLVPNRGLRCRVAFDTDLLRTAAVGQGDGWSPVSMAQGSCHTGPHRSPPGQNPLPAAGRGVAHERHLPRLADWKRRFARRSSVGAPHAPFAAVPWRLNVIHLPTLPTAPNDSDPPP